MSMSMLMNLAHIGTISGHMVLALHHEICTGNVATKRDRSSSLSYSHFMVAIY